MLKSDKVYYYFLIMDKIVKRGCMKIEKDDVLSYLTDDEREWLDGEGYDLDSFVNHYSNYLINTFISNP